MIKKMFSLIPKKNGKILTYNIFKLIPLLIDSYRFGKRYPPGLRLKEGDTAADFALPDIYGQTIQMSEVLKGNKVVLIFYRGGWCPFCNLQLRQYQDLISEFEACGAKIIAISPEVPDRVIMAAEKEGFKIQALSDLDNVVARKFTQMLRYEGKSFEKLKEIGIDLNEINQSESGEVPIPAVFVIGKDMRVLFARSEGGDYKKRVNPGEVLAVLKG